MAFTLSAFGDEIASDLEDQLKLLVALDVRMLDLRAAWDTNVLRMSDEQVARVQKMCAAYGVEIACIGSPIGKSPIIKPIEDELANLRRIMEIATMLGTRRIRIFSFYPPDISTNAHYDQYVEEAAARLIQLTELAEKNGFLLLLENEKEVVGDTPERCLGLLRRVNSLRLRFIWDPANFVQVGVERQIEKFWDTLGTYVGYIHIKDALLTDGSVKAAGEGDGQIKDLLLKLVANHYDGVLSLEPHLAMAGHSSGFSGTSGMTTAVNALRSLLAEND
jgi:sugar phosphate isomerase/epimerase